MRPEIPYRRIGTVFLDMGNTLSGIDLEWVREELAERGLECSLGELQRAEAAARPRVSELVHRHGTESLEIFHFYLGTMLEALPGAPARATAAGARLTEELLEVFKAPGASLRLWSAVLPGVPQALERLRQAGRKLVVVSNSDGRVEELLIDVGLRPLLDGVVESHHVGCEKPDPRIFRNALELAGSDPSSTLHVGDLYHADVLGARAAGIWPVLVDPYGDWDEVDCERVTGLPALADRLLDGS